MYWIELNFGHWNWISVCFEAVNNISWKQGFQKSHLKPHKLIVTGNIISIWYGLSTELIRIILQVLLSGEDICRNVLAFSQSIIIITENDDFI